MKKSFLRFLIVSFGAMIIDFGLFYLLSHDLGITYGKLCSTSIACIYSYFANKYFTFKVNKNSNEIIPYFITQVVNIGFNTVCTRMVFQFSNSRLISFVVATVLATFLNFFLQQQFVFKRNKDDVSSVLS